MIGTSNCSWTTHERRGMRWKGAIAGTVLVLLSYQPASAAEEEPFYKQATRAVFRLQTHQSVCVAGRSVSEEVFPPVGTAFFVEDYLGPEPILWAVTARHVVAQHVGADLFAKVRLGADKPKDQWLRLPSQKWFVLNDGSSDKAFPTDVAVMPLTPADGYKSFVYCSGKNCPVKDPPVTGRIENQLGEDPTVPDPVLLLGFPSEGSAVGALEPFARAGIVAYSTRDARFQFDSKPMFDLGAFVIDAFGWPGNSGGPVMSQPLPLSGPLRLLGLITGSHLPSFDFSIVTPVSSIKRVLDAARIARLNAINGWLPSYKPEPHVCGR